jgi:D-beta-D-heptose 7-phosphate kinase/D-beta-D-heptose 1-phosphate adenosyltransferase
LNDLQRHVSIQFVSKIVDLATLLDTRRRLKLEGKRLVFTNGCFDLIHAGHVRYLAQARSLGDALAVGLNSDRSVRALKGAGRPILVEQERAEVIGGLGAVDFVIVFDEETPLELIAALLPDVLVKGGDWSPGEIVGREEVEAAGGTVCSLPYLEGSSTTEIIDRIKRLQS